MFALRSTGYLDDRGLRGQQCKTYFDNIIVGKLTSFVHCVSFENRYIEKK